MIMQSTAFQKQLVTDKWYVHFTYAWNIPGIKSTGLKPSCDGQMGKAIYACQIEDIETIERIIVFMEDEINWYSVAEHLGYDDPDEIEGYVDTNDLILPVFLKFTGEVYVGLRVTNGINISGYIGIISDGQLPELLHIGCSLSDRDINEQIDCLLF